MNSTLQALVDIIDNEQDYVVSLTRAHFQEPLTKPKFKIENGHMAEDDIQSSIEKTLNVLEVTTNRADALLGRSTLWLSALEIGKKV